MEHTLSYYLNTDYPEELPIGWKEIFQLMCISLEDIIELYGAKLDDIIFLQIKEKYGAMRIYKTFSTDLPDNLIRICEDIIDTACSRTASTCCKCGNYATYVSTGWILPYCRHCAEEIAKNKNKNIETCFAKISR